MQTIDHTGKKYHRLTAIRFEKQEGAVKFWLYTCECGNLHVARANLVTFGNVKSCGCLQREYAAKPRSDKPKRTSLPEYQVWQHMRRRCLQKHDANYGGRGISVCEQWSSFDQFLADVGRRPSSAHSLDRIDNNGNYEPVNCRWATKKEQAINRRNTIFVDVFGKKMALPDAAVALGVNYQTLRWRLKRNKPLVREAN